MLGACGLAFALFGCRPACCLHAARTVVIVRLAISLFEGLLLLRCVVWGAYYLCWRRFGQPVRFVGGGRYPVQVFSLSSLLFLVGDLQGGRLWRSLVIMDFILGLYGCCVLLG